ncbi:uncharacterized protein LOC114239699 isoform X4 [Bombyx mandarina]|uniref:Uncharacterized protein LOC114239699 isoform X4 n=1 Tax=Bombyx mandarina TaxID=7092 RepID=A0A6J2J988_BOMMA|nr:uncharacterized protein LOC114239699 isoform X4 [Bombyx mandarina]
MPEKPKRRKNKNKRKNKHNQQNSNGEKNACETSAIESSLSDNQNSETSTTLCEIDNVSSCSKSCNNTNLLSPSGAAVQTKEVITQEVSEGEQCDLIETVNENISDLNDNIHEIQTYIVETPEQKKPTPKISNSVKSKSLDNDDDPKIVEITDDTLLVSESCNIPIIDCSNVIVTDVDSDVGWEKIDELKTRNPFTGEVATESISITTLPLNVAQCENIKSLTPDQEASLRNYLKTLNLSTSPDNLNSIEIKTEIEQIINREVKHRLRKKASADDSFPQKLCPPRMLDVIDEEGSSESSMTSRRHSYLSEKRSDFEDLEDDVFEDTNAIKEKFAAKPPVALRNKSLGRLVTQECVLVDAKIKEPEVSEARGDWTMKTVEKLSGAEVVYLTDSSSSTSSIHEIEEETDDSIDTDVSVRMITPTIEVIDTEHLLKKNFLSSGQNISDDHNTSQLESQDVMENKRINNERFIKIELEKNTTEDLPTTSTKEMPESHEIVVLSTDNINTNLYVKELGDEIEKLESICKSSGSESTKNLNETTKRDTKFDLEIKVIKCELNDAFNNLIKEVTSDSESSNDFQNCKENFTRQDSSSSVCSSQSTAKYNPTSTSLNDISDLHNDEASESTANDNICVKVKDKTHSNVSSHVNDVIEHVTGESKSYLTNEGCSIQHPNTLREISVKKIASLPYGDKILEELASVSERLQNVSINKMSPTKKTYSSKDSHPSSKQTTINAPPPIKPRVSSLKKPLENEHNVDVAPKSEPKLLSMSPSQKMLMEKTNSTATTRDNVGRRTEQYSKKITNEEFKIDSRDVFQNTEHNLNTNTLTPLKSQTGSRLLALICDPTITSNVNSLKTRCDNSFTQTQNNLSYRQLSKEKNDFKASHLMRELSGTFKPIPPPRPRKISLGFYESDDNSDFAENSLRSIKTETKKFHFSTGNLNKEIESDISSIQNMHRFYTNVRDKTIDYDKPRRPSLPKDLCEQQMEYIRQKEKEVEAEIQRLENQSRMKTQNLRKGPRAPLISEKETIENDIKNGDKVLISRKRDVVMSSQDLIKNRNDKDKLSSLFSSSQEELQREKMYTEYMTQMAERMERKHHKVIKITNTPTSIRSISKSMPTLENFDSKVNNKIEKEFISKARERWEKLGIRDPDTEDEREVSRKVFKEPKIIEHKIKVIESGEEKDVQNLPSHLQDFIHFTIKDKGEETNSSETVMITPTFKARSTSPAVWRPGAPTPPPAPSTPRSPGGPPPPPPPPVWTPGSAEPSPQPTRKTFRPVHFEETPPSRRKFANTEQNGCTSGSESEGRLRTSQSAPATGLNTLSGSSSTSRLPRVQNPTVTLLQKAREGQLPRGPVTLQSERDSARLPRDRPSPPSGDPVHALRREYASESEAERRDYERIGVRKMSDTRQKVDGVGPITKDGMPITLRSEVKDPSRWYKKMYDTIHKNKYDDDYVTIRYKSRREAAERVPSSKSQYAYFDPRSGYLSEPEGGLSRLSAFSDAYDSDVTTGPRRRTASVQEDRRISDVSSSYLSNNKYSTLASARASQEVYKNQPGRIENYVPGKSSVVDKEAKQWWDEVMDIFDGQNISSTTSLPQPSPKEKKDITAAILSKSNMAKALKESGYESDSTLIFRRREETDAPLSPAERRAAYRDLQAGGEPPLRGFRSPAPPRQDETEIEYIPISPTLTKIRVHKKTPQIHEVVCYPVTSIQTDFQTKYKKGATSLLNFNIVSDIADDPPAPPRRISSKNSRTLKFITSNRPSSMSPKRASTIPMKSNVDFLKDKISHKLTRQNTQIISPNVSKTTDQKTYKTRLMSTSAPPSINRNHVPACSSKSVKNVSDKKTLCTSSFGSSRRILVPTEYSNAAYARYSQPQRSIIIEGGAGRKTPISNVLDKMTSLDRLWSAEKRNEKIDVHKVSKSVAKNSSTINTNRNYTQRSIPGNNSKSPTSVTHKSRDMIRTAEKVQRLKLSSQNTKSTPCLAVRSDAKFLKPSSLQTSQKISKSSTNIPQSSKKQTQVRTAVVTNLKKKKSLESIVVRPKIVPCHETCNKKSRDLSKINKKNSKLKTFKKTNTSGTESDNGNQFGDNLNNVSNMSSVEYLNNKQLIAKEIKQSHDAVTSHSFFQHLFLGRSHAKSLSQSLLEPNTTVRQKAKMFQTLPIENDTPKSLNSYLIHRKPVSLSRFKVWDRYPSPKRPESPRSISWPGRLYNDVRKCDSLNINENFGSTSSLATVRSKSEPPINKIFFSQTSRPKSPKVVFYKKNKTEQSSNRSSTSPNRLFFSQAIRPISPKFIPPNKSTQTMSNGFLSNSVHTETELSSGPVKFGEIGTIVSDKCPSTIFFSQTSRPVSPKIQRKADPSFSHSRSHSTSPISLRSPSYRRIHSVRSQINKNSSDLSNSLIRTRSAGDADKNKFQEKIYFRTKSDNIRHVDDPDYDEYLRDVENTKARSERFRELNRYYTYLERVAELEKTTSTSDLRHRKRDEEIIDFDRWKKIRAIERAEEELNNLYHKLKIAQSEKDFLFYPRDLKDYRWNYDRERGLRVKERSVEDLKDHFQHISNTDSLDLDQVVSKDTYKPLWRGSSVAETAFYINKKSDSDKKDRSTVKPVIALKNDCSFAELRKKIGLGNRLWSSLSMDQVNALKNQLNAIYSKELESKMNRDNESKYTIDVNSTYRTENQDLRVRRNSLITPNNIPEEQNPTKLMKSDSLAAIPCPVTSVKELKNNVNKIQMNLSENEKKKISQTLSKELLDRIHKFEIEMPVAVKQETELKLSNQTVTLNNDDILNDGKEISKFNYQPKENETETVDRKDKKEVQNTSASETETASSDNSSKTVIYRGPSKEVLKKVQYFESVKNISNKPNTVFHAREGSDEKLQLDSDVSQMVQEPSSQKHKIVQSRSCSNIKEFFGETEQNNFLSLPMKPEMNSRTTSPHSVLDFTDRHTPDTLFSSDETIWRSRSPSPDPERYWRAYLNLARAGEVRRLARRFDSPSITGSVLRRHRSDPEIARNVLNKSWPSFERISTRKHMSRAILPVARVPLRTANRFMPHIDIISKLAALRRRTAPRSRSAEEALECRPGEVNRIRRRFEAMSLLGQLYASAPDVSELHDIAPYLAGTWIAHRFPKPSDNNRSIKDPYSLVHGCTTPIKKDVKLVAHTDSIKLSSILKHDTLPVKEFDPSLHRPVSRYEPPRAPPRPPPASWPQRFSAYGSQPRHSVTFQETDSAPEPPRRTQHGSYSDAESPRRYVESDVNIHYRCPVRHDPLPLVPERELARQQAEHMKRLYREQKRNKYLQEREIQPSDIDAFDASIKELQDMQNRRHQDNFTPSQKTVVPLNRYDDADKVLAKALYTFNGQTSRELSFRKGDIIFVRRQIDANWYEGEIHGRIGLFPYNYVEIQKGDTIQVIKKPSIIEGRARAKFDFIAQTNLELPLKKGEVVTLTRRIDQNWWEGRNGLKTGIFPDSYVTILQEPSQSKPDPRPILNTDKPAASPAAHGLLNGSDKRSMGSHSYTPQQNNPALANAPPSTQPLPGYVAKPAQATLTPSERGYGPPTGSGVDLNNTEPLYVDTNAEAIPYRAMYKYRPQNPDELELNEGDTVYVLEKCDDGWYVGSSQRTGRFGTFPGNYVERI